MSVWLLENVMEIFLLPVMIAAAVGILAWWGTIMLSAFTGDRRKISQRLSNNARPGAGPNLSNLSVVLKEEGADVPKFLASKAYIQTIQRKLAHAFPEWSLQRFLTIAAISAVLPAVIAGALTQNLAVTCGAFAIGGYLPIYILNYLCRRRITKMTRQLPEALDFLSRVMRSGHSLSTGLQMMADELPKPLSTEFRTVYDQHSLGQSLEEALKEMSVRIDATDFSFFVTAVLIQRQTGGDLSEVLGNISTLIRQRMRLCQSVGAKTAEGRLTGYILVAFPVIMFAICYYLNPELYGGFAKNETGKKLLGLAAGLVLTGIWAIRKITTVRV
jgi:tight adherence protein B